MTGSSDQSFWTFSLTVYSATGVAEECLALQDECGIDINLLLFCAYIGSGGSAISAEQVRHSRTVVQSWQQNIVMPLRNVRHALKHRSDEQWHAVLASSETLRTKVKAVELESECIEQALLQYWASKHSQDFAAADPAQAVVDNIRLLLELAAAGNFRALWPDKLIRTVIAATNRRPC